MLAGAAEDCDPQFPVTMLTMRAARSSCKERWAQTISEADRVGEKHLVTLEAGSMTTCQRRVKRALSHRMRTRWPRVHGIALRRRRMHAIQVQSRGHCGPAQLDRAIASGGKRCCWQREHAPAR